MLSVDCIYACASPKFYFAKNANCKFATMKLLLVSFRLRSTTVNFKLSIDPYFDFTKFNDHAFDVSATLNVFRDYHCKVVGLLSVAETNNVKVLIKKCKKGKHVFQQDSRSLSVAETTTEKSAKID
jgi:hypothetical protein